MKNEIFFDELEYADDDALSEDLETVEDELDVAGFTVTSAADAYLASLNEFGRIKLNYMSQISGISKDELIRQLNGTAMLLDPAEFGEHEDLYRGWVPLEVYKSGNLMEKLELAKEMNDIYHLFDRNIDVLEKSMPDELTYSHIHVSLGANWVPADIYASFLQYLFRLYSPAEVSFNQDAAKWHIRLQMNPRSVIHNVHTYGTRCMTGVDIIERTMNAKPVKVYDHFKNDDGKIESVLNKRATLEAQEKQRQIIQEFDKWIFCDEKRRKRLQKIYCEKFVCNVGSKYNGSFLSLPGLNKDVKLYEHQLNAIARIILTKDVLVAHSVGSGKTYELVIGAHERHRMGLSKKNLVVAPNNVIGDLAAAHRYLYPEDSILYVDPKKEFAPSKRVETIRKIKENSYVAIYMAYSSFDMLSMSEDYRIEQCKARLNGYRAKERKTSFYSWDARVYSSLCKTEEKRLKKLEEKKEKRILEGLPPNVCDCFDELGITSLFVDEAHNYKNISINSMSDGVVGMHNTGSKKCDNMMEKIRYMQKRGGSAVFATGTPLTNSMADLFTMMSYLQPDELRMFKIDHFDQFINTFGERSTHFEIDVDSVNFRMMTRFSSFHNIPELMSLFSQVCDYCTPDLTIIGRPDCDGYTDVLVEKSEAQKQYILKLAERAEAIRARGVKPTEDNMLKITTDGKKCALDMRLVQPEAVEDLNTNKVAFCAKQCFSMYQKYPGNAQIVFCDISTPKDGFNVYQDLKERLIAMGMGEDEIAFIHDGTTEAKRTNILKKLDKGELRLMIGSTEKLGQGVNVQSKLIAIHHLDVPWRPADMVQREGRIIRQGNTNQKVFKFRYITSGSFDAYNWQILENKQRFISSFLSNEGSGRSERDISDSILTYSEVKALAIGNPLIKKRVEVSNELQKAKMAMVQRRRELDMLASIVEGAPRRISNLENHLLAVDQDIDMYLSNKKEQGKLTRDEREAFGQQILDGLRGHYLDNKEHIVGHYLGFDLVVPRYVSPEKPYIFVQGSAGANYSLDMKDAKALGCISRIEHCLANLIDVYDKDEKTIEEVKKAKEDAEEGLTRGNPFILQVEILSKQLEDIDQELTQDNSGGKTPGTMRYMSNVKGA